jgi:hypothetical protein
VRQPTSSGPTLTTKMINFFNNPFVALNIATKALNPFATNFLVYEQAYFFSKEEKKHGIKYYSTKNNNLYYNKDTIIEFKNDEFLTFIPLLFFTIK